MSRIRDAQAGDHDAAMLIWFEGGLAEMSPSEWHSVLENPSSALFVAEEDGEVVGTAVAAFDGWRAYVYHVAVTPRHRGHGIGKALMGEAETWLAQRGARRVFVAVREDPPDGLALATVMGYELEGETVAVKELEDASPSVIVLPQQMPAGESV